MFTGIIQSLGSVKNIISNNNTYTIITKLNLMECKIGSSICGLLIFFDIFFSFFSSNSFIFLLLSFLGGL